VPLFAMALSFAGEHPAVASVILGPKRPTQLTEMLAFADLRLGDDVLDAIDEIVAPGRDVNPADAGYARPSLDSAARRRQVTRGVGGI
jgi:aryl-alcohol dehydrogenase-like predicted oxidoreductase